MIGFETIGNARSKKEIKEYFIYYRFNSADYWTDLLKIKSGIIIRSNLEKYKKLYYIARSTKKGLSI